MEMKNYNKKKFPFNNTRILDQVQNSAAMALWRISYNYTSAFVGRSKKMIRILTLKFCDLKQIFIFIFIFFCSNEIPRIAH